MKNIKQIFIFILILLMSIIIFQNLRQVDTKILFYTITLPHSILLFFMVLIGFVLGIMTSFRFTKRKKKSKPPSPEESQMKK